MISELGALDLDNYFHCCDIKCSIKSRRFVLFKHILIKFEPSLIDHGRLSLPICDVTLPAQFRLVRHRSNVLTLVHSQSLLVLHTARTELNVAVEKLNYKILYFTTDACYFYENACNVTKNNYWHCLYLSDKFKRPHAFCDQYIKENTYSFYYKT